MVEICWFIRERERERGDERERESGYIFSCIFGRAINERIVLSGTILYLSKMVGYIPKKEGHVRAAFPPYTKSRAHANM